MKASLVFAVCGLLACPAFAGFENWTSKDGKTAELELIQVIEKDGEKAGEFRMRNGKTVTIKASGLTEEDAGRLADWQPSAAESGPPVRSSVFDKHLDGNLVKLEGKSLKRYADPVRPAKYYLFYYTASWCGPCQRFTPSLVEFYERQKRRNPDDFEIILITSDSDEDSMEAYAREKKMSWPHLKLNRVGRFAGEFKHPGNGIPNLVLTDTEGKILKASYEDGEYKGPAVVMEHLGKLLKK